MAINDNAVNMNRSKPTYHHGGLRAAVLGEALRLLESATQNELSLREVARNVGVTPTALYRHFPDKDALLAALAREGLDRLAKLQATRTGRSAAESFADAGRAYVRFALGNPALFRLIFSKLPMRAAATNASDSSSPASVLRLNVTRSLGTKAKSKTRYIAELRAWSLVHGLAMLILDAQVDRKTAETLIDGIVAPDAINLD